MNSKDLLEFAFPNANRDLLLLYLDLCTEEGSEEIHHILPKSLFKAFKDFGIHPWNKSLLSSENHLIAHFILAASVGVEPELWKSVNACFMTSDTNERAMQIYKYQEIKELTAKMLSLSMIKGRKKNVSFDGDVVGLPINQVIDNILNINIRHEKVKKSTRIRLKVKN
ncbi:hypothetical protein [Aliivibrio fischeri]|uniref:hypothetical protein n=1 Tax=Aliivibrio fischeri TaxID=668 RepID=UPI001F41AE79|nr:hypothetical protein [Aliivibrio fischeri]MCE7535596.1 hypothetical protein [Aliivibrio fischeri]MCE7559238.1 hypothetical protein [Aliivibrio fischeri]